ncbi:YfbM family protein [Pseudoduganella buxea]|nr:YfbM family protein [Pseudoduganella buxea]GGB99060.1 hypothetical protein GCM10011572_21290 [Pseudoduganella buxea]
MSMIGSFLALPQTELAALRDEPERIHDVLDSHENDVVDVDKAWHGIHFLLTGTVAAGAGPLANVVFGRVPVGDEDVGYGPAMATDAADVPAIAAALASVTDETLRTRFAPDAMAEIYPNIWDEGDEALDYLLENLDTLRTFYRDAAAGGLAVITWLN